MVFCRFKTVPGEWPVHRRYRVRVLVPGFLNEVAPFGLPVGLYWAGVNMALGDLLQKKNDFNLCNDDSW